MTKDRTESKFVELLLAERDEALDEARDAMRARHADAEAIARLSAQNEHQAREIARLTADFASFKRMMIRVYPEMRQFLSSDFAPLQDFPS